MIQVLFKNLDKSDLARELVKKRLNHVVEKFPDLRTHKIITTLSMENSPLKPGPDSFTVKLLIQGKKYKTLIIEKSAMNIYAALAEVIEHSLELLNRQGDKMRVIKRNRIRRLAFA